MSIIEIYKDSPNTIWQNSETFLCVFDKKNNIIADYDFCTGLKVMQNNDHMTIFINNEDLIAGKWVFFAKKNFIDNGEWATENIKVSGNKKNDGTIIDHSNETPWNTPNCGPGKYVTRKEREDRLNVCKKCPLFDSINITCTVNNEIVLKTTKYQDNYCPEGKWGDMERVLAENAEQGRLRGELKEPNKTMIDDDDQLQFESDFEKFLEGL